MKENFVIRIYGTDNMAEIPTPADYPKKQSYRPCKVLLLDLQKSRVF
jgi:hypothetical protein